MSDWYVLDDDNNVVAEPDVAKAAAFFEQKARRIVDLDIFMLPEGEVKISTVFLGLDHRWGSGGEPVVFETMVFGGPHDQECSRCCTYAEALEMHKGVVDHLNTVKRL